MSTSNMTIEHYRILLSGGKSKARSLLCGQVGVKPLCIQLLINSIDLVSTGISYTVWIGRNAPSSLWLVAKDLCADNTRQILFCWLLADAVNRPAGMLYLSAYMYSR